MEAVYIYYENGFIEHVVVCGIGRYVKVKEGEYIREYEIEDILKIVTPHGYVVWERKKEKEDE